MDNHAVIDLGSNTFHIVIYNFSKSPFEVVFRKRVYVFLSEEGVQKIGLEAYQRGLTSLAQFHKFAKKYKVKTTKIVGTATLRSASNGITFINDVKKLFDWNIDLITGDQEAAYISRGIQLSKPPTQGNSLIMDIGGGSVEFIMLNNGVIRYQKSYPIGISILYNNYHKSEPISQEQRNDLKLLLKQHLSDLLSFIKANPIDRLIGASGTFEVFKMMNLSTPYNEFCNWVQKDDYHIISNQITKMTLIERLDDSRVPENRAKHITVALLLIDFVLDHVQPDRLMISDFALKEGLIAENKSNF